LKRAADRGQTVKYLFKLADAKTIETVVMHYEATPRSRARTTICVSSQVGCPIGCSFCATGQSGFDRNLSEAEIVDQFLAASRDLGETQRALTNVVFMGMGEPLNNYAAVVGAIRRWARPDTLNFSPRRVTVSTIGLVPFIERLSAEGLPVNLALSLHAPERASRGSMIPFNRHDPCHTGARHRSRLRPAARPPAADGDVASLMPIRGIFFDAGNTLVVEEPGKHLWEMAITPIPDALEVLTALKAHYRLGVISNTVGSGDAELVEALEKAGIRRLIDALVTSRDFGVAKPDPAIYAEGARRLGV